MKTLHTQTAKPLLAFALIFMVSICSNSLSAQQENINVKGTVKSADEPLDGVSIYLKNSSSGTVSKADGSFKFPRALNVGDILVFSYLGFTKQSVVISKDSSNLDIVLEEAPIDILSALNTNKPYKSKRKRN